MALLSTITNMITPAVVDRVAAALGINSALARTAINIALPLIIAAFAKKAATPAGASELYRSVQSADPGLAGSLDSMLGGAGQDKFLSSSTSMLNGLLGGGTVDTLIGTLGSKAGLGSGAAAMLVPLAGQFALSGMAKDSSINSATDLANSLASEAKASGAGAASAAATAAARSSGGNMWMWIIPILAVAALAWYLMQPAPETVATPEPAPAQTTTEAPAAAVTGPVVVDGVDVTKTLNDAFGNLTSSLGTVTDAASAQTALPKLQEVSTSLDAAAGVAGKFSAEQKTAVGALITAGLPAVRAAAEKALAAAGAGDVLKPVVDGIIAKIEGLAG